MTVISCFSFAIVLNFTQLFPDLYDIPYLYCLKMSDLGDITKLKVPELKSLLKERGLPISGTKQVLIERLGIWIAGTDTERPRFDVWLCSGL